MAAHNRSGHPSKCAAWVSQPTVLYAGMEWDDVNIYHFFLDNFVRLFATVAGAGLFDVDTFLARCCTIPIAR